MRTTLTVSAVGDCPYFCFRRADVRFTQKGPIDRKDSYPPWPPFKAEIRKHRPLDGSKMKKNMISEIQANCPFYGRTLFLHTPRVSRRPAPPFLLFPQVGNRCALATGGHVPCQLEIERREIDWRACPRIEDIRML